MSGTIVDAKGNCALVDYQDFERLSRYKWTMMPNGYFTAHINGKSVFLHRAVMNAQTGYEVDHINHDKSDCRRLNLRVCTRFENARNRPRQSNNSSGYKGVSWHKKSGMWRARIKSQGKMIELGYYRSAQEAYQKYCEAAKEIHGEYACVG